jgi:hypothetical protein
MHTMQTTVATTLGSTVLLIADWQAIAPNHEHHVSENL